MRLKGALAFELVTVLPFTLRRPNSSVEFADSSADSGSNAVFSLPEDASASASNVAISSVFRVVEGDDFASVAEGYWEGKCRQYTPQIVYKVTGYKVAL